MNQTLDKVPCVTLKGKLWDVNCILEKIDSRLYVLDLLNHIDTWQVKCVLKSVKYEATLSLYIVPMILKIVNNFKQKKTVYITPTYRGLYQYKDATLQI